MIVLMPHRQKFISSSAHYFNFHHPSGHSLHALCVMLGKKPKVPRLCFLILQSENIGSCPKEAFNTEIFFSKGEKRNNQKTPETFPEQAKKTTVILPFCLEPEHIKQQSLFQIMSEKY